MNCPRCSSANDQNAKFCAECGWDLSRPHSRMRWTAGSVALIAVVTAALWGAGSYLQTSKAGVKPTKAFHKAPSLSQTSESADPEIAKLRSAVEAQPDNLDIRRVYAQALLEKIRQSEQPSQALVLEATDALGGLLRMEPKDPEALIALADISFNQKVFDKSLTLYQRYLAERPDDLSARARYASSLAFVGRAQDAVAELQAVLDKDPRNFHALAYMSIAYAQLGNAARAQEVGNRALEFAPSPEAKARFQEFLTALSAENGAASSPQSAPPSARGGVEELAKFVALNSVAGPKYVDFQAASKSELTLLFRDFPMENMPPFAKEKFLSGIRDKAKALSLEELDKVIFKDADSGKVLEVLELRK